MTKAAAPKIELRDIDKLNPDPNNARTHSKEQVEQIAASVLRFGWTNPILTDDLIRAGHGRQMAARLIYDRGDRIHMAPGPERGGALLPERTVPVLDCTGWTEDERRAYNLADNQLALNAGWDDSLLQIELQALSTADFTMELLGFDTVELDKRLAFERDDDPEDVPPLPDIAVSILGDQWVMDKHQIRCGSSTNPEDVAALLGDIQPHLMVTDPPYGVNYDANWRNEAARSSDGMGNRALGAGAVGKVMNDDQADWTEAWALFPGDVAYVWHAGAHAHTVADSLIAVGFEIRSQIIWNKQHMAIGRGDYHWKHEPCWYAVRKGKKGHYNGDRKQTTVWDIDKPQKSETGHSTQKPVECMQRPMLNNSKRGDFVYEPFSGSGTSIVAGEDCGRHVLAMELSPDYVDIAVIRWQNMTGKAAIHAESGRTFDEVTAERTV